MHILSRNEKHFVILVIKRDAGDSGVGSLIPRLSPSNNGEEREPGDISEKSCHGEIDGSPGPRPTNLHQ